MAQGHGDRSGAALALASAALFGASTPLAKLLIGEISPWLLAGLLYLGSGIGLALLARILPSTEEKLARADLPWLSAVIATGGILGPVLLMLGLRTTPAASAALLLNLEGVFTLAIAWIVFRENVDLRIGLGAAAILAGAVVLSAGGPVGRVGWGAGAIALACLAWAIDNNLTRKLSSADPVQIAMIKGLAAGSVNIVLALLLQVTWPPAWAVGAAGIVGFLGYGVSLALFVHALRHLGAARTTAYFSAAPFVGAFIAIVGLGEPLSLSFLVAAPLVAIGLYLHLAERHEHPHQHEPLTHAHRHVHDTHHQHGHAAADPPGEPHTHTHAHARLVHQHPHFPDIHHRHVH
ncbi:MAG TPA: EamA family transporter [Stellaceae bacterium]|nr:EamA family transporter [Stellaceae bacterium]